MKITKNIILFIHSNINMTKLLAKFINYFMSGDLERVKTISDDELYSKDIDIKASSGGTYLAKACLIKHYNIVEYLLEKGARPHNSTSIKKASEHLQLNIIKKLINVGEDFNDISNKSEVINKFLENHDFEFLNKILENNDDFPEIKKLIKNINNSMLTNSLMKHKNFKDITIYCS